MTVQAAAQAGSSPHNVAQSTGLCQRRAVTSPLCSMHGVWQLLKSTSCLQIDRELDADTPNAGQHRFEKMVSGMYMGEVARRAILKLAVSGLSATTSHTVSPAPSSLVAEPHKQV